MATARAELYHSLGTMLNSGLPVLKALDLAASTSRGPLRRAFRELLDAATRGEPLAPTMRGHPESFTLIEVMAVEAGETSGRLGDSLERLSRYFAFRDNLHRIIRSGLILPTIILHVAALIIPVVPLVLGQAELGEYLLRVLGILALFYVPAGIIYGIVRFTPETGPLRVLLDGVTLHLPILGRAVRQLALSRYCRTFEMLYACGSVPIAEVARESARLTGHATVRRWVEGGAASAEAGRPVSEGFSPRLPVQFQAIWRIGEESGKLDETAARLAAQAAEDSERLFEQVAVWLPRIVYALVSALIIYYVFSGYLSIYGPGGMYDEILKEIP